MKKLIIIFILFVSCQSTNEIDSKFDFKLDDLKCNCTTSLDSIATYTSLIYDFKIDFPKQWEIFEEEDTSNHSFNVLMPSPDYVEDNQLLSIQVSTWKDSRSSVEYFKDDIQNIKINYNGKIIEQGQYSSNRTDFNWVLVNLFETDKFREELLFYSKKGNKDHYLISFTAINLKDCHEKICQILPFIDSFEF